jgi:hypothetical protein
LVVVIIYYLQTFHSRLSLTQSDLRKPVNDTTSSALAAGRLICGDNSMENGSCGMHETELAVNHAAGFVIRKKRNEGIVDSFPACDDFRKRAKEISKYFVDGKSKARWDKYEKFCYDQGLQPVRLILPNKTRVAGTHRMYELLLRNFWGITKYHVHMLAMEGADWKHSKTFLTRKSGSNLQNMLLF